MQPLPGDEPGSTIGTLIIACLGLILLVVLLYLAVTWIRRQIKGEDAGSAEGFTLSDLRRLHKSGQMTDDEYEKAKLLIIGTVKAPVKAPPAKKDDKPGIEQNKP